MVWASRTAATILILAALAGNASAEISGDQAKKSDELSAEVSKLAASDQTGPAPIQLDKADQAIRSWLGSHLRDPQSASISLVRAPRLTSFRPDFWTRIEGSAVCYDVNAKNGYGGYTGAMRYLFVLDAGQIVYQISQADQRTNSLAQGIIAGECSKPA